MALPARAGTHLEYTAGGHLVPADAWPAIVFATEFHGRKTPARPPEAF
jgi:hypothetical protein